MDRVYSSIVSGKCTTLSSLMKEHQGVLNSTDLYLGEILSKSGVSSELTSPINGATLSTSLPTFTWLKKGGSTLFPNNSFSIVFYNSLFTKICEIYVGNVSSYKLTANEWSKILTAAKSDKKIYWSIKASQTSSPSTGPYYSNYRYFYIP